MDKKKTEAVHRLRYIPGRELCGRRGRRGGAVLQVGCLPPSAAAAAVEMRAELRTAAAGGPQLSVSVCWEHGSAQLVQATQSLNVQ